MRKTILIVTAIAACANLTTAVTDAHAAPIKLKGAFVKLKKDVEVPALGSGVITNLFVRKGDIVDASTPLGELDQEEAIAQSDFAQSQYDRAVQTAENEIPILVAKAASRVTQAEYDASLAGNRRTPGAFSPAEVRRLKFSADRSELEIEQERFNANVAQIDLVTRLAELRVAKNRLDRRDIKTKRGGMVVEILRHEGEFVREGDTIARVVQLDVLTVSGFLNVQEDGRPRLLGRQARVTIETDLGRRETLAGKVTFVNPVPLQNGDYQVEIEVDNKIIDGEWLLQAEQPAEVEIRDNLAR